jgi:sulfur-oxidizing protein SoxY
MGIIRHPTATRRIFMTGAGTLIGSFGVAPAFVLRPVSATPAAMAAAIREVVGEAALHQGRVKLDIPPLVENGNTVSVIVSVDSPMSELDHVKSIHIFNEKNPQPNVTIAVIRFCEQGSDAAGPFSQRHCSHSRMRIAATSDCHRLPCIKHSPVPNPFVLSRFTMLLTPPAATRHRPVSHRS